LVEGGVGQVMGLVRAVRRRDPRERILSTAPRERRGEDELGGKESRQLLLTASVAEQNKF